MCNCIGCAVGLPAPPQPRFPIAPSQGCNLHPSEPGEQASIRARGVHTGRTARDCPPTPRVSSTAGSSWQPRSPRIGTGEQAWGRVGNGGYWMKAGCSGWWSGLVSCGGQGVRRWEGWGGRMKVMVWVWFPATAHPMNQKGHHRSYTCVKSRPQVITGEQQMLHLRDSSRTTPDELEFTSEPQRQSSSQRQQWEVGIKTLLPQPCSQHRVLPPRAAFPTDHPYHYRTLMPGTSRPPPRPLQP